MCDNCAEVSEGLAIFLYSTRESIQTTKAFSLFGLPKTGSK
jgi:hypothetical protein